MIRGISTLLAVVLLCGAWSAGPAAAQGSIVLRTQYPDQSQPTWVMVQSDDGQPVPGAVVSATYRPGSSVSRQVDIGTTDASGRIEWTPLDAGIVTLSATHPDTTIALEASTNISVKFASPPASGIIIMVLAGVLLLGGSAVRFTRYLRSGGF